MTRRARPRFPALAALALLLLVPRQRCAAQEGGKLGMLALPSVFYMPETGIGGGGLVMATRTLPAGEDGIALADSLRAGGSYTQKGQASAWVSIEAGLGGTGARLGLDASVSRYPSRFFGLGPSAAADEAYVPFMGGAAARAAFPISPGLYAGPRIRFAASRTLEAESEGLLAKGGLAGSEGYVSTGLGFALTYDARDSAITPTGGGYLDLGFMASPKAFGSSLGFGLACLDARAYLELLPALSLVLALQARAEAAFGDTPFQELPRIGGDKLMRGYYDGRYRDDFALALQAEVRMPIWGRLGIAVFGGLAQVAQSPAALDLVRPKASGGLGLRVRLDEASKANMRVDIAWADGGPQCYFNFGEAF